MISLIDQNYSFHGPLNLFLVKHYTCSLCGNTFNLIFPGQAVQAGAVWVNCYLANMPQVFLSLLGGRGGGQYAAGGFLESLKLSHGRYLHVCATHTDFSTAYSYLFRRPSVASSSQGLVGNLGLREHLPTWRPRPSPSNTPRKTHKENTPFVSKNEVILLFRSLLRNTHGSTDMEYIV